MSNLTINRTDKETGELLASVNVDIRAYAIAEPKGKVKGFANVNLDGLFAINGISIIEGSKGLFVSMPQVRDSKNEFRDVAHPVTAEGREALNKAILTEFGAALDAMVTQKESTLNQIRESAKAAKEQVTPAAEKGAKDKAKKNTAPEH